MLMDHDKIIIPYKLYVYESIKNIIIFIMQANVLQIYIYINNNKKPELNNNKILLI